MNDLRLGNLLLRAGLLNQEQLDRCLELQSSTRPAAPLGQVLLEQGVVDGSVLGQFLMLQGSRRAAIESPKLPSCAADVVLGGLTRLSPTQLIMSTGQPVSFRLHGCLQPVTRDAAADTDIREIVRALVEPTELQAFEDGGHVVATTEVARWGTAVLCAYSHSRGHAVQARVISRSRREAILDSFRDELLPRLEPGRGLLLVGASDQRVGREALAALVDRTAAPERWLVLLDDEPPRDRPPETPVVHRRVGEHTADFESGLRFALEQRPDLVFVADANRPEVIEQCVRAAAAGITVVAAVRGSGAIRTLQRLVDAASGARARRRLLAAVEAFWGVECLPSATDPGEVAASEFVILDDELRNALLAARTAEVPCDLIQRSGQTMTSSLAELIRAGRVRYEDAFDLADDAREIVEAAPRWF